MKRTSSIVINIILFIQVLLLFLFFFEDRVEVPAWLQVAGRLHPLVLHLPIGFLIFLVVLVFIRNRFKKKQFKQLILICLLLISLSASIAALFGLLLSIDGDYGADALQQHRLSGIVLSLLCYFLLVVFIGSKKITLIFYTGITIAFGVLIFAGHTGSVLTHGENFVLAPIMRVASKELSMENSTLYEIAVEPVLEKKCFSCHNESKSKGELVMTSIEKFKKGGKEGVAWRAGNPDSSRMIRYIHLPLEDDDHMPPDGKSQLTTTEIFILESWIKAGADFEKKIIEYNDSDTIKHWVAKNGISKNIFETERVYSFSSASKSVIDKLNTPYRAISPLYVNSPALQADFFIRAQYQAKAIEELSEIKDQLVVLNLSKMPVKDSDFKTIRQFKNLEKLNLNFSEIKGGGLADLKSLQNLNSLSLSGTVVDGQSIEAILSMPSLQELFIWDTQITKEQSEQLQKKYPNIKIVQSLFNDDSILKLSKPILVNEGIIKKGQLLQLKHAMSGVKIIYSLDSTEPDSLAGLTYDKPIAIDETTKLKVIACKDGWYCSGALDVTCFVEGYEPEKVVLLTAVDKQYPAEGAKSLTDGRKGLIDLNKEPSWLGFRDNNFEAVFNFGSSPPTIQKIVLSYGDNLGGYIFPPAEVEVWAGKNQNSLTLLKRIKSEMPTGYRAQRVEAFAIDLKSESYPYYKIVAKPVNKLPEWHRGKGQKGWFFIDEIFFY